MRHKTFIFILFFIFFLFPVHSHAQTADAVIAYAKKFLGVRYVFGGSSPAGFDCSGFLWYVFKEHGITLPRTGNKQYNVGTPVAKANLKKGDLVFFETYKKGPSHSGIYLGDGTFISATSSKGVSVASLNDPYYWGSRYLGAKRVLKETEKLPALPPGQYHDVPESYWAYQEIKELGEKKIVNGYEQSLFYPDKPLTRAEAAAIIARVKNLSPPQAKNKFPDVSHEHWASGPIHATAKMGYFTGFEDGTFRPNEPITREQTAALLKRVFQLENHAGKKAFTDVPANAWSYSDIQTLAAYGIAAGFQDGSFRPKNKVTRAQFAVFLYRAIHLEK